MQRERLWNIKAYDDTDAINKIASSLNIGFPTACLLYGRGYVTPEQAKAFLCLESELFHDPFMMPDMDKAVNRIIKAVKSGEKTVIYGDYDVDGVTSVSLVYLYLKEKGASVSYYIPNRVGEGYGVNTDAIKKLTDDGNTLIITVDTGVTAISEAEYAKSLGCDTVITDHHECKDELPRAEAVVNPMRKDSNYPFPMLAGVGVAFKLVCALEYALRKQNGKDTDGALKYICSKYIDLVALGTVADVMPLKDENRLIVSMGLSMMEKTPSVSISALLSTSENAFKFQPKKKKINASVIGYQIAPKINAAGRMASASRAVELFLSQSREEAEKIACELTLINKQRQEEENKIASELKSRIEEEADVKNSAVIVLENDGWLDGVIGIVASRITEKYGKPSILISFDGDNGKGSGRSIKGLNLVDALTYCSPLLTKYGGHELAAGLSIKRENLDAFKQRINEYAEKILGGNECPITLDIDCELSANEITLNQALENELLEPCGTSNPTPTFACFDMTVCQIMSLGGQGKHTKLILEKDGKRVNAVLFGTQPEELDIMPSDRIDIAFRLSVNEFMGVKSEQILVRDIRLNQGEKERIKREHSEYEGILLGEIKPKKEHIPNRPDFISLYLHLKRNVSNDKISVNELLYQLSTISGQESRLSYVKLHLMLDIMNETGLIEMKQKDCKEGRQTFNITVPHIEGKVDLERSCIYKQLMS